MLQRAVGFFFFVFLFRFLFFLLLVFTLGPESVNSGQMVLFCGGKNWLCARQHCYQQQGQ